MENKDANAGKRRVSFADDVPSSKKACLQRVTSGSSGDADEAPAAPPAAPATTTAKSMPPTKPGLEIVTNCSASPVPPNCVHADAERQRMDPVPCMLGIDEAGRGPVLGPLVYGAAYWPVAENDELSDAKKGYGFDDSKQLAEGVREKLYAKLQKCNRIGYLLASIPAEEISAKMLRRLPYSLNAMLVVILQRAFLD